LRAKTHAGRERGGVGSQGVSNSSESCRSQKKVEKRCRNTTGTKRITAMWENKLTHNEDRGGKTTNKQRRADAQRERKKKANGTYYF